MTSLLLVKVAFCGRPIEVVFGFETFKHWVNVRCLLKRLHKINSFGVSNSIKMG